MDKIKNGHNYTFVKFINRDCFNYFKDCLNKNETFTFTCKFDHKSNVICFFEENIDVIKNLLEKYISNFSQVPLIQDSPHFYFNSNEILWYFYIELSEQKIMELKKFLLEKGKELEINELNCLENESKLLTIQNKINDDIYNYVDSIYDHNFCIE